MGLEIALPGLYDILAKENFNVVPPEFYYGSRDSRCEYFQGRDLKGDFRYFVIGSWNYTTGLYEVGHRPAGVLLWFSGWCDFASSNFYISKDNMTMEFLVVKKYYLIYFVQGVTTLPLILVRFEGVYTYRGSK